MCIYQYCLNDYLKLFEGFWSHMNFKTNTTVSLWKTKLFFVKLIISWGLLFFLQYKPSFHKQLSFKLQGIFHLIKYWQKMYSCPNPSNKQSTPRGSIFVCWVLYRWFMMTQKCPFHLPESISLVFGWKTGKICHRSFLVGHLNSIEKEIWWWSGMITWCLVCLLSMGTRGGGRRQVWGWETMWGVRRKFTLLLLIILITSIV